MQHREATSVELEGVAVAALSKELRYWYENQLPADGFDDDVAIEVLLNVGVRPSRLGTDLDRLIFLAHQRNMRSMLS